MKVTLVSPYSDITSIGLRLISACLRKRGKECQIIFLPYPPRDETQFTRQLQEIYEESLLVGISVMSNYFHQALARAYKKQRDLQ